MKLIIETENGQEEYEFEVADSSLGVEEQLATIMPQADYYTIQLIMDDAVVDAEDAEAEAGIAAARHCKEFAIASLSGVPETKVVWEKQCGGPRWARWCINVPVIFVRQSRLKFMVKVCVDSKPALKLAEKCIKSAAIAGAAAAAWATPAAAVPAIKVALAACLAENGEKAAGKTLSVKAWVDKTHTDWKRKS